jgi:prepilin-type processing-associated H-X9-DG protein
VRGELSYEPNNWDNFNTDLLLNPQHADFAPYIATASVYKCPADRSTALWNGQPRPRVRSYSYNLDFSYGSGLADNFGGRGGVGNDHSVVTYRIQSPSKSITFIEQHEDTLGKPYFLLPRSGNEGPGGLFADIPAGRHGRACAVAFADGHVEARKWLDPRTVPPVLGRYQRYSPEALANNPDIDWLIAHRVVY